MARYHGKATVVYVDGYDLSGDSNNIDVQANVETAEVTAFSDNRKQYVVGHEEGRITHNGWFNDAGSAIHEILSGSRLGGTAGLLISAAWGTAQGSKGVAGSATLENAYNVTSPIGGGVAVSAEYISGGSNGIEYVDVLQPKASLGGSTTPKDDTAETTNGARFYRHLFSIASGTPQTVIYHGTVPAGAWVALGTFTGGTSPQGSSLAVSGTVYRYVMGSAAQGTGVVWVGYRRL